jgi:PTS system nitrogen regulatory IIA component
MKRSIKTVAKALDLPVSTVERWIRQGRIPLQRHGNQAAFSPSTLEKWAASHHLPFNLEGDPAADSRPASAHTLVAAMQRGGVHHRVTGRDAASALRSAVEHIDFLSDAIRNELADKLIQREALASTGIGNGIAIPHPREPLAHPPDAPVIVTCFLDQPIDFKAIDDRPVFILFILVSPSVKDHLHLLSRLSYCIRDNDFVNVLTTHPDAATLQAHIATFEKRLDEI